MAASTVRHKVLALHGYTQNAIVFSQKAAALRKALEKIGVDITFIKAPHKVTPAEASAPTEQEKLLEAERNGQEWQYWGWAFADDEKKEMRSLDISMEYIKQVMEQQGPFDGIIGFSQGAALSAIIASMLETNRSQNLFPKIDHPPVKFFVSISGFRMRFKQYDQFYPISTPSLHLIGELDTIVIEERMVRLAESCVNPQVIRHPGGHFIPNAANIRTEIVEFIQKNIEGTETSDPKI